MRYEFNYQAPTFTVANIDIVNVSRDRNFRHSNQMGRPKHGFLFTVSGRMAYTFHGDFGQVIYAETGELIFIPQGTDYTGVYLEDNTELKIVQFDLVSGKLPDYLARPVKPELPDAADQLGAFFNSRKGSALQHPFYSLSCLYALLWQIDELYANTPSRYKRLKPALTALSDALTQTKPIGYYAALCDMSEVSFRRLFREYTGSSPVTYRNELRLENARSLLQGGGCNVTEAAEASGFSNLSFFIRLYKKKYGHTPKATAE